MFLQAALLFYLKEEMYWKHYSN